MVDLDFRFYLTIFLRRLPYFLAIVVMAAAIAVVAAYLLPKVYRASAKILLEAPQISTELARSTVSTNPIEQLEIIQQQIMTRDNLLALASRLKIYGNNPAKISEADAVRDMQSRVGFEQLQLDTSRPGEGATIFNVSFDAETPELAARVVNEIAALILNSNTRVRTDRAENTTRFFNDEVVRLGSELKQVEADILKFKNENKDALPDGLDFRRTKQNAQQERLALLEREEAELRSRRNSLVQTYDATGQVASAAPVTLEQQQLQDLNRALSEQLAIFSETSPNVVALRSRIAALQDRLRSEQTAGGDRKSGLSELDLQLSDIDGRISFIAKERSSITLDIAELTKAIDATPRNETVLNSLERNRANIQTQYNAAIARLAEASTGEQIEVLAKGPRFSLVEPAIPPQYAKSPKRRLIAAGGVAGGIGLGFGFIVLLEILNKTIRRPSELVQLFQTQPLATIPYIWTASEARAGGLSRRLSAFVAAGAAVPIWPAIKKLMVGPGGGRMI
jgi:succinoglycan biosynthesis transport protein ExoP